MPPWPILFINLDRDVERCARVQAEFARHGLTGQRLPGVSEWTFVGTRASDGARVEGDGCDLFTFQGDRIRVKDSWRKLRTPGA